jgi:6-phosphofructokinase
MESKQKAHLKRVGIVFAGGPAPGANAVIGVAASAFRRRGTEVIGILNGYAALERDRSEPLREGEHYHVFEDRDLWGLRNARGIVIGTGRSRPGRAIHSPADFDDPGKTKPLENIYDAFGELELDALISIGGDGTLKTANFLSAFQRRLPESKKRVAIVHVPKTIDNDYRGIDFTFGFFTAVGVIAEALQTLRADAMATRSYFIAETMGRRAGWLAYGVAIAGEAHMVVGVEDVVGDLALAETETQGGNPATCIDVEALVNRIVDLILTRERRGKFYGTVVLAEGLAELLPEAWLKSQRDAGGHLSLHKVDLGRFIANRVSERYEQLTGRGKKVTRVQLGYEARSCTPHAFDVLLASQLGLGAYRALAEEKLDAHMVSVTGQLELRYIPFSELVDADTLETKVRFVEPGSDFHRLAQELGTRIDRE